MLAAANALISHNQNRLKKDLSPTRSGGDRPLYYRAPTPEAEAKWVTEVMGKLLENGAEYVKPGGILVYSTCTIEDNENRKQIADFLAKHREWKQSLFPHPRTGERIKELQLLPQRDGVDGFYLTVLRKDT